MGANSAYCPFAELSGDHKSRQVQQPADAAEGFQAPGVVVSYTDDPDIQNGKKFLEVGLQVAAGVPLQCDEPEDFLTFRIGLFGLDKLNNVDATVSRLEEALNQIL